MTHLTKRERTVTISLEKAGIGEGDDKPHFLAVVKAGGEEMTPQTMMITGVAVSVAIQLILRYTKRPSHEGLILFLILIFLSAAGWVVGFAIGGWKGMGYSALAMMVMMASMAGLVTSFIFSLLVKE